MGDDRRGGSGGGGAGAGSGGSGSPPEARGIGPDASASPDTGAIRGFSADRQDRYPVAGGAVDAVDRRADEEEASAAAHEPLGPSGYVEERDLTGGPATFVAGRTGDPTHEPDVPGDLVVEGPDAGPVLNVLPPRAGEEEEGAEPFYGGTRVRDIAGSRWLGPFASTLHHTRDWIRDTADALGTQDPRAARHALHAVLAVLRDQLPAAEIADLAACLPLPIRGLLFEGWRGHAAKVDTRVALLERIERLLGSRSKLDPEHALKAVMEVLRRRVPAGELDDIEGVLPADLKWVLEPV